MHPAPWFDDEGDYYNELGSQYVNSGLTDITLPSNIDYSDSSNGACATPFAGCKNLKSINVASGSGSFTSIDGVLYKMAYDGKHVLVAYPPAKAGSSFTIPRLWGW